MPSYQETYHTVVLFGSPAIESNIRDKPGKFKIILKPGIFRKTFMATGRKPLKN